MRLYDRAYVAPKGLMTGGLDVDANEALSVCFKILDFKAEKLFRDSREPVYLKGQHPPTSLVGAIKDLGKE